MPVQSVIKYLGLTAPEAFSVIVGAKVERLQPGNLMNEAAGTKVTLTIRDWANKEAAQPVYKTRLVTVPNPTFDPKNSLHVAQWEAYKASPGQNPPPEIVADNPLLQDGDGNYYWHPSEVREEQYWDGDTVEQPMPDRLVELNPELSFALLQQLPDLLNKLYQSAMSAPGAFVDPVKP